MYFRVYPNQMVTAHDSKSLVMGLSIIASLDYEPLHEKNVKNTKTKFPAIFITSLLFSLAEGSFCICLDFSLCFYCIQKQPLIPQGFLVADRLQNFLKRSSESDRKKCYQNSFFAKEEFVVEESSSRIIKKRRQKNI